MNFVLISGFVQSIILILALLSIKNRNKKANQYLIALIVLISIALIGRLTYSPKILAISYKWAMIPDIILYLYGPLLLLYIRSLLTKYEGGIKIIWWHFILAMCHLVYVIVVVSIDGVQYNEMAKGGAFLLPIHIILTSALITNIIFWIKSIQELSIYKNQLHKSISYTTNANYLLVLLIGTGVCLAVWGVSVVSTLLSFSKPDFSLYSLVWIFITFLVYGIGYFTMSQPQLFQLSVEKEKYQGSRLSVLDMEKGIKELKILMQSKKLFLNPKLSKSDLEINANYNSTEISRIINEGFNMNFFDFVNSYRIKCFIEYKNSGKYDNYNLVGIAKEAGFNSKTTFNTAFKKHTGMTPKSYFTINTNISLMKVDS
ncbi:MAG: helix-turn-helix domain-containing protein [Reichenbachiella sp.]